MTLLECECTNCGCVTGTAGEPPEFCGNCGCQMGTEQDSIESHLSDRAVEYAEDHIGKDIQMAAIVVPPVPRDKVEETVEDYDGAPDGTFDNPVAGHLYDLTDISLAINHAGDPMLDHSVEDDEEPYDVTDETVAEIKVARGALMSCFNRELAALADRLELDTDQDDLVTAIREEVGYSVDVDLDYDSDSETDLDDLLE